jgi:hypothetical protein
VLGTKTDPARKMQTHTRINLAGLCPDRSGDGTRGAVWSCQTEFSKQRSRVIKQLARKGVHVVPYQRTGVQLRAPERALVTDKPVRCNALLQPQSRDESGVKHFVIVEPDLTDDGLWQSEAPRISNPHKTRLHGNYNVITNAQPL